MQAFLVLALATLASANLYAVAPYKETYAPAHYNFDYAVKDGKSYVDMGHKETRDKDVTKGSYNVVLPDGRRQVVNYYVDGYSGYVADVQYVGEKAYAPAYAPVYAHQAVYPAPQAVYTAPKAVYHAPVVAYQPAYKPVYQPAPVITYAAPKYY